MTVRKLLLVLVPVAVAAIVALLLLVGDGPPVTAELPGSAFGPRPAASDAAFAASATAPPAAGPRAPERLGAPGLEPDSGLPEGALGERGQLLGRLLDPSGHPVPGEPVLLVRRRDRWDPPGREDDRVPLVDAHSVSGEDGRFALDARAGVEYGVVAGGAKWTRAAVEPAHAGDNVIVTLLDAWMLEGLVVDQQSGLGLGGAQVLAIAGDSDILGTAGPDGSFRIGPLPADDVIVGAWAPGFDIAVVGNVAPALGRTRIELPPPREVKGLVVDRDTQVPVGAGQVTLQLGAVATLSGGDPVPVRHLVDEMKASIGPDGSFVFPDGVSMDFRLLVEAEGYVPLTYDRYERRALNLDEPILVRLRAATPLTGGVVQAAGGAAVPGARVAGRGPQGEFAAVFADAQGRFELPVTAWDGEGPVFLDATDGKGSAGLLRLGKDWQDLLLELVPELPLGVRVVMAGQPVAGAEVAVLSGEAPATQAVTRADGTASLTHARAGPGDTELRIQARWGRWQSLPVVLDPAAPPADPVELDLTGGGWIEGLVATAGGQPLPSALVELRPDTKGSQAPRASVRTDEQGRFRAGPIADSEPYRLDVSADGWRDARLRDLFAGQKDVYVPLDPVVSWHGRVLDAASGQPMEDFGGVLQQVVVRDGKPSLRNTRERLRTNLGGPGQFAVELPEAGDYVLRLFAQDYVAASTATVSFDGLLEPPPVEVLLSPAAILELTVLDGRGRPVPGIAVSAIPWDFAGLERPTGEARKQGREASTNTDGLVRLALNAGGAFRLASGREWIDASRIEVRPGPALSRTIFLPPTGDLEVTVRDEHGMPVLGAFVEVRTARTKAPGTAVMRRTGQGRDGLPGVVLIEALPPGQYDVSVRSRGYDSWRDSVILGGNAIERRSANLVSRNADGGSGGKGGGGGGAGGRGGGGGKGGGGPGPVGGVKPKQ